MANPKSTAKKSTSTSTSATPPVEPATSTSTSATPPVEPATSTSTSATPPVEPATSTSTSATPPVELGMLESYLQQYLVDMAPRVPLDVKIGATNQYTLWKTIEIVLNSPDYDSFQTDWRLILKYFNENYDKAFAPRYVFRFAEFWEWSEDDLGQLQAIINIIHLTANPDERTTGLKQVDFELVFQLPFTEIAKQNLMRFFK